MHAVSKTTSLVSTLPSERMSQPVNDRRAYFQPFKTVPSKKNPLTFVETTRISVKYRYRQYANKVFGIGLEFDSKIVKNACGKQNDLYSLDLIALTRLKRHCQCRRNACHGQSTNVRPILIL